MSKNLPKYPLRFFRWFCHPDYVEDIEGDLMERFEKWPSKWRFAWEVIKLLRPGIIKKPKVYVSKIHNIYLAALFFRTGFRNLKRLSVFSIINSIGLSIGLIAVFCIYQYVTDEYQTDSLFSKKDKIFRLIREVEDANASYKSPTLAAPYYEHFTNGLGLDQKNLIRVYQDDELVSVKEISFFEEDFLFTDPHFFEVFDYQFLHGDATTFSSQSNSVVLSKKTSQKYFGNKNPIGKFIELEGKGTLKVTGVLADQKYKSHLSPALIAPISSMGYASRLLENKEVHAFSFYALSEKEQLPVGQIDDSNPNLNVSWQPLNEIYFDEEMQYDIALHGDKSLVDSLFWIGLLIVIISGANFFNTLLTTLLKKIRDFGVRKVFGSNGRTEILKVLVETYIIVFFAIATAVIGGYFLMKKINKWYATEMSLTFDAQLLLNLVGFSLLLTIAFAYYPAVIASSVHASSAISKKIKCIKVSLIQEGLLTFQLVTCMTLIVLSLLITHQYEFLQQKELGLNPDQVVYFHSNNRHSWKNRDRIKDGVASIPGVREVAMAYGGLPGTTTESVSYGMTNSTESLQWKTAHVSPNFLSILEVDILAGRDFNPRLQSDINATAIINEAAANLLGWPEKNILGLSISNLEGEPGTSLKIIGVADDFHFESYKKQIEPTVFITTDWEETFVVKLASNNSPEVIQQIAEVWKTHVSGYPFNYQFLDENFDRLILEDTKHRNILYLFSGLSLIIAISGLLGLSAYLLQSRKKEIAIRSVLGASMSNQLVRISSRYFKMLILGAIVAIPASWWLSQEWLSNFSYRVTISPSIFIYGISIIMVFIISIQTIQVMRSVSVNPVESLKDE